MYTKFNLSTHGQPDNLFVDHIHSSVVYSFYMPVCTVHTFPTNIIDTSLDLIWPRKFQFKFNHSPPAVIFKLFCPSPRTSIKRAFEMTVQSILNTQHARTTIFVDPLCPSVSVSVCLLVQFIQTAALIEIF